MKFINDAPPGHALFYLAFGASIQAMLDGYIAVSVLLFVLGIGVAVVYDLITEQQKGE